MDKYILIEETFNEFNKLINEYYEYEPCGSLTTVVVVDERDFGTDIKVIHSQLLKLKK